MAIKSKVKTILNKQQTAFLAAYLNPKSATYSNAMQSALSVGYKQEYAENITHLMPDWLSEGLGKDNTSKMLSKAERNLDEFLELDPNLTHTAKDGTQYTKFSSEVLKVKADVSKFVAERIGRSKYGSKELPQSNAPTIINHNLFYQTQFQSTLRSAEAEMKKLIENAQSTETNTQGQ